MDIVMMQDQSIVPKFSLLR